MTVRATDKWKAPVLSVQGAVIQKPRGNRAFAPKIEAWLIANGYATPVDSPQGVLPERDTGEGKPGDAENDTEDSGCVDGFCPVVIDKPESAETVVTEPTESSEEPEDEGVEPTPKRGKKRT